ncbi:MAG: hypothetical protein ACRDRW_10920 [Pseudonocardiaceae bacterium]
MISNDDVVRLVQTAGAYDGRKASEVSVPAWADASGRGRWTYPEAVEAIKAHYAESTAFIMPAHVTERIRARRRDTAMRNPADPPDRAGQKRLAELMAGAFQTITDDWHDNALSRRCPSCDAAPGSHCTRAAPDGDLLATRIPHPARMKPEVANDGHLATEAAR